MLDERFYQYNVFSEKNGPNLTGGIANQDNVITVQIKTSYKQSDIRIDFLPKRVVDRCKDKDLLELEYLQFVEESTTGRFNINVKTIILN